MTARVLHYHGREVIDPRAALSDELAAAPQGAVYAAVDAFGEWQRIKPEDASRTPSAVLVWIEIELEVTS